jgi:TATA-box binding protein (TBP) (component of TFIID and TFIIIB)
MDLFDEFEEMNDFENNLSKYLNTQNNIEPTKLKISIMSATSSLNTILNLKSLSKYLKKDHNICFIDSMFNMTRKISNMSKKKIFYNQITLKIRPYYNPDIDINLNLMVNLKLFRNGKLQLCGLKNENDGLLAIKILVKKLNIICKKQRIDIKIFKNRFKDNIVEKLVNKLYDKNYYLIDYSNIMNSIKDKIQYNLCIKNNLVDFSDNTKNKLINNNIINITKYNITLINSDFFIGFKLNRTKVYNFILNDCKMLSDYDPCIYQGVLIKFYWNNIKTIQDGRCCCKQNCNGKGTGTGDGQCKKITVSIFQSGNIIITGKCCRKELYYIYNFIVNKLVSNMTELKQISFNEEPVKLKRRNISILIKNNKAITEECNTECKK